MFHHLLTLPRVTVASALRMLLLMFVVVSCLGGESLTAQTRKRKEVIRPGAPHDYRSKNFLVHTDIGSEEADELLGKLETMLGIISKYWGRPLSGTIECYVVKDLKNWPAGAINDNAVQSIATGGGITLGQTISQGNQFIAIAPAYAVADRGTPQHEAVHAYCILTFGGTGPIWYAEGMAEMGQYWDPDDPASVNCHKVVAEYLRASEPKSLAEIVDPNQVTGDSWQNYAWRWALCHMLANNPNYSKRFRPLGMGLLTKQPVSFESVYGSMAEEISFEYLFFLEHFDIGYRVDLTSWDWKTRFQSLRGGTPLTSKVEADHGWQPARVIVTKDEEYEFSASGNWKVTKDGKDVDADGTESGEGKLEGIIFDDDYKLSEPFEMGTYGSFTAPKDGKLFVRCQDKWSSLADNSGKISLRIKVKGKGNPLPKPTSVDR